MMRIICVVLFATTSVLFGQLDSNSITVTASRSVYSPLDQVLFSVLVSAPVNTTLDDVVAALQGSGITAANLSGSTASLSVFVGSQTQWIFVLPAPLANMKNTIASLTTLQQTIAQKNSGLKLTFNVQGTQVSPQLQDAQQCPIPDLLTDARTQAQNLAAAAGLTLGPVLAIAQPPSVGDNIVTVPTAVLRSGDFSFGYASFLLGSPLLTPTRPAVTCSIVVKFALLRYQ